jgi:acyl-CoA thioester hydrolase
VGTWRTSMRVRFHELDAYGHVNHGVYLNYFEQARVELLDELGFGLDVLRDRGIQLVVVEVAVRFRSPAGLGDRLVVETDLDELRRASSIWDQRLLRGDDVLASATVRSAATDAGGRPIRPPADLVTALTGG